jgi:hypothetical protein
LCALQHQYMCAKPSMCLGVFVYAMHKPRLVFTKITLNPRLLPSNRPSVRGCIRSRFNSLALRVTTLFDICIFLETTEIAKFSDFNLFLTIFQCAPHFHEHSLRTGMQCTINYTFGREILCVPFNINICVQRVCAQVCLCVRCTSHALFSLKSRSFRIQGFYHPTAHQ